MTVHDQLSDNAIDLFLQSIFLVRLLQILISKNINIQRYKINAKEVQVLKTISYKYLRLKNLPLERVLNFYVLTSDN